ncbi:olfactory receptor 14A16-like [Zootoca vivipara]|uniref:olfactory receptor 14A16-like n=1 Tax=Zootoca vivipara TaxID=8524 RepID=UPI00293BB7F6|nr:olfactory receptor 14A16-like [Zootoca vivipara]
MFNTTTVTDFVLLEFSAAWELQLLHFIIFLVLYLASLMGNLLIISAVASDHHLHRPMYFFMMNLAIQDLGQVSVIVPKSMANSLLNTRQISYSGCVAQILLFNFFISSNFFLLTLMAYDRYVAICNPLYYEMVMNKQAYIQAVACVWISGFLHAVLHTSCTFATPFCSNVVNQFFCEIPQLLKLACSDLYLIEIGAVMLSFIIGLGCFTFIIVTYVQIFYAVLRIPSVQGRQKAYSTCIPHLTVISTLLFCGFFAYLRPTSNTPSDQDVVFTVVYSMVPPMLNPVIYSLRNKEIKAAVSKLLGFSQNTSSSFLL